MENLHNHNGNGHLISPIYIYMYIKINCERNVADKGEWLKITIQYLGPRIQSYI